MIYELRAYDLSPGQAPRYLNLFRTGGMADVTRHLPMAGYWLTDTGALNRIYHLWIYETLAERDACRAGLAQDRAWNEQFVPQGFPLIIRQENMMMALEQGSDALAAVTQSRRQSHPAQSADQPMFAPGLLSLSFGAGGAEPVGLLGRWRVMSGTCPGQVVRLFAHGDGDPFASAAGAVRHEILRALSCSPLR